MEHEPKISIILPVKPGGVVSALERLRTIDYPADRYEIIVAEGARPSLQRNRAAAAAKGEILYFLDDDSHVSPRFLRIAAGHYSDREVAAAGGPSLTPDSDTVIQKAFGLAFASLFGGGKVRNRYRQTGMARGTDDSELILCNLSFRRAVFLEAGGLDERLYPNEENELMERLREGGARLVHDPQLAVRRSQRPTVRAFVRQLFTYGRGRGEQTLICGVKGLAPFIPSIFFLYLCLLPFADKPVYSLPFLCYAVIALFSAISESVRAANPKFLPLLFLLFPLLHLSYGAGLICGLVAPRFRGKKISDKTVVLKVVKEMECQG